MAAQLKTTFDAKVAELYSDEIPSYCDVQIIVARHKTFNCHKLVLSLRSEYFANQLYPSPLVPFTGRNIEIIFAPDGINVKTFEKIMRYLYTGEVEETTENFETLLPAARKLCLKELLEMGRKFLWTTLDMNNCVRYWKIAKSVALKGLEDKCEELCLKNFTDERVYGSKHMDQETMRQLMVDDDLEVKEEMEVCETMTKWLDLQKERGKATDSVELLACVRWSGVDESYVTKKLFNVFKDDEASIEFLKKVVEYKNSHAQFEGLRTFHRKSTKKELCVIVLGPKKYGQKPTSEIYRLDLQREDQIPIKYGTLPGVMEMDGEACSGKHNIFITGVGEEGHTGVLEWRSSGTGSGKDQVPVPRGELEEGREKHCAVVVNGEVYVLGGEMGGKCLKSIEKYDPSINEWKKVGELQHAVHSAACVIHNSGIYVFGGMIENNHDVNYIQVFDTFAKTTKELITKKGRVVRLPVAMSGLRAAKWDRSAILMNDNNCVIFYFDDNTFQDREQYKSHRLDFGLVIENGTMFIISGRTNRKPTRHGWQCAKKTKSIPVSDLIANNPPPHKWRRHATFPYPAVVHAYAVTTEPAVEHSC